MRTIYDLKGQFTYAMHGCGAYRGILHSNSADAFDYWRNRGENVYEVDVALAADGFHVAVAHGLSDDYLRHWEIYNYPSQDERTRQWFLGQRLCHLSSKGLRTMSAEDIINRMKNDEDVIVIFDLYNLWSAAAAAFAKELKTYIDKCEDVWNRILIECYFQDQVEVVNKVDTNIHVIFCVNDMAARRYKTEVTSVEKLLELGVEFVSYPWKYLKDRGDIKKYKDAGMTVMSLTHTNPHSNKLKKAGVNINNVDICLKGFDFLWIIPIYLVGRVRYYSVKVYDHYIRRFINEKDINGRSI